MFTCTNVRKMILLVPVVSSGFDDFPGSPPGSDQGLIPLESLFDQNDVAKYPKVEPAMDAIEDINIITKEDPKIIKLSKKLPAEEKDGYVKWMKKYTDVFAWRYEDLKEYDTSII